MLGPLWDPWLGELGRSGRLNLSYILLQPWWRLWKELTEATERAREKLKRKEEEEEEAWGEGHKRRGEEKGIKDKEQEEEDEEEK